MNLLQKKEKKSKKNMMMTEGNIWIQILTFSVPLLIGNLFQQLYNTVDSIVVGNFVGKEALAAVGSSSSLINLIIGMFTGIATGAGVLIAQYYGAKDEEKLQWAVHTATTLSLIGGVILTIAGFFLASILLKWMGTPEEVMPNSTEYLRIYFLGSVFNLLYNMEAGILRAVGDSRHPLYYLCIASVVNTVLDFIFVVWFQMGVAGVGLATIIAQAVSAVLVFLQLQHSDAPYRLYFKKLGVDRRMAGRIIRLGVPSGLQTSIISLSNVVVQANINSFGELVMAGCGAYGKIDGFVMLPIGSFSMAAMTFVGQNYGANKMKRAKQGVFITSIISLIYIGIVSMLLFFGGKNLLQLFSQEEEVIRYGMVMLRICTPFYAFIAICHVTCGAFRGTGRSMVSMMILVLNLCVFRMIWVNIMTPIYPRIETVLAGYPITWFTGIICCILYAWKGKWLEKKE
jgi:putative MATE family efflux protein